MTPREELLARIDAKIAEQRVQNGWTGYSEKTHPNLSTESSRPAQLTKLPTVNWNALSPWGWRALGLAWIFGGVVLAWIIGSLCIGVWKEVRSPGSSWALCFLTFAITIGSPLMLIRALCFLWGGVSMLVSGKEPLS